MAFLTNITQMISLTLPTAPLIAMHDRPHTIQKVKNTNHLSKPLSKGGFTLKTTTTILF